MEALFYIVVTSLFLLELSPFLIGVTSLFYIGVISLFILELSPFFILELPPFFILEFFIYTSNLGTFWLKIEQFWPFEEISIFSNGGHLGYQTQIAFYH
jgi:hypothetical protein